MQLQLKKQFNALTIHTGQHYDANMSAVFFDELDIPKPDFLFDIKEKNLLGEQTAVMMTKIEEVCVKIKPDAIIIYGDTNSTLAAAIVAAQLNIKQIHIEAGLRSYNRQMPEEINRIIADEFASLLFCPTAQAIRNLDKEGINHRGIFLCGDVMYDMLKLIEPKIKKLFDKPYYFSTIHRPYNTDKEERLSEILNELNKLDKIVIFPIHPRTVSRMKSFNLETKTFSNIHFIEPVGYVESVSYQKFADCVITDSGGMQKEAYMLKRKCITIRSETEWIETLKNGWNTLIFERVENIQSIINTPCGDYVPDIYGNGHAAEKIVDIIAKNI